MVLDNNSQFPKLIFSIISGGEGYFQEFQIIPEMSDYNMALSLGKIFYRKLGDSLREKFGNEKVIFGDNGYLAPFQGNFQGNEEALEAINEVAEKYNHPVKIGINIGMNAAIGGKKYSAEELKAYCLKLIDSYNIQFIEDLFGEGVSIIIDDFVGAAALFENAIAKKTGNVIIIKLNQTNQSAEISQIVKEANDKGLRIILDVENEFKDNSIIDLAANIGAWGVKIGTPSKLSN